MPACVANERMLRARPVPRAVLVLARLSAPTATKEISRGDHLTAVMVRTPALFVPSCHSLTSYPTESELRMPARTSSIIGATSSRELN
jgi:hypothetical protein